MRTTTNEKLEKVITDIENTKAEIEKSKEKIKKLNAQKKKLELQIEKEKHNELCSVLSDYGIKSVNDFRTFWKSIHRKQVLTKMQMEKIDYKSIFGLYRKSFFFCW